MNRLHKLLVLNRAASGAGLRIQARAESGEATILVYGVLIADKDLAEWYGGIAPEPFVRELQALDAETIHLRINSPGGDVFAARPMVQALREHGANVITHIDGYAASAATLLALAGDEVRMTPGGFFMIHNAWSIAIGNAKDLLDMATLLEKVDGTIRQDYIRKTGRPEDEIRDWMDQETWFAADEAKDAGFVDLIDDGESVSNMAWNLSAYASPPRGADRPREQPDHGRRSLPPNTLAHMHAMIGRPLLNF